MISRNHGIDIDLVRQQREIDPDEAIQRYLSEQSQTKLRDLGYKPRSETSQLPIAQRRQQRLSFALNSPLPKFRR